MEAPLCMMLDKVARASAAEYSSAVSSLGLRPKHVGLLAATAASDLPSQSDIGAWLGIGPSAVVALVDEAEKMGLVKRAPDPANRRRTLIALTALGRQRLGESLEAATAYDATLVAGVPAADLEAFARVLTHLAGALHVAGATGTAPQGPTDA